jgi:ubiquinone/menaquinone biosynthesis C-methylase UbiE
MMFSNAEAYDKFMGRWSRLLAPLVVDFAVVPKAGWVLDVGSGIGSLAFEIVRHRAGVQVMGIDPSKEFVAHAERTNPFPERVSFHTGDVQDLQFADDTFAASISLLVFNFIRDPEGALRELRRVTQPGGRISAAVWDYGAQMHMLRAFWDSAVELDPAAERLDEKQMPLCRAGELSQLWKRAGLRNVQEEPLEITMNFDSFPDYWDPFLLGQGPAGAYVRTLQNDHLQALRTTLKRRLSISAEHDPFTLTARVWAVRGDHDAQSSSL